MLRCIACDEQTREKLTQEIHEGHHVGMMISKFASSSTFPSYSSFQVLPKKSWSIILGFFCNVVLLPKHQQYKKFHKLIRSFHSKIHQIFGIPCLSTYWLANAVPETAGVHRGDHQHLPLRVRNLKPKFLLRGCRPLPLSFHSTMLGRSGNRQFFFNQTFFA